jgi:hypothetical protein
VPWRDPCVTRRNQDVPRCHPATPQGNYSDVLVYLSSVYSQLRGDAVGKKNDDAAQVGVAGA